MNVGYNYLKPWQQQNNKTENSQQRDDSRVFFNIMKRQIAVEFD